MLFKTHPNNIPQIKAHIKAVGATYFHGDGNLYAADEDNQLHSDNNVTYSNPKQEEAKYRVKFTSVSQVPDTVEELNEMLLKAKNQEILTERATQAASGVKNFEVEAPVKVEVKADTSELDALRAELAELRAKQAKADKDAADKAAAAKKEADAKAKADKDAADKKETPQA